MEQGLYWNIFSAIPSFQGTLTSALLSTSWNIRAIQYALPSLVGFFSGIFINKLGPKYSLLAGCVGYPLKIAAYLCYDYTYSYDFIAFAGLVLTACQGISGSVVPYLMLAHPTENSKGISIASFLGLWSLSALIGSSASPCADCIRIEVAPSDIYDRSCSHRPLKRLSWVTTRVMLHPNRDTAG